MSDRVRIGDLAVARSFHDFVANELLPGTGIEESHFWDSLGQMISEFTPINRDLLDRRDDMQRKIDAYHRGSPNFQEDPERYEQFLRDLGYLVAEGDGFEIGTTNVDPEIATIAGPQLVVPVSNARFALNAANARWGSLYDALYGTNVIDEADGRDRTAKYNPTRGAAVVARASEFLDRHFPLAEGHHADVTAYTVVNGRLEATLGNGGHTALADGGQFVGHAGDGDRRQFLLVNNGLHVEIVIDPAHPIGAGSTAGVCDVVLESAVTTIQDCEDSVAAVDAMDKVGVYRNWLGLMRGTLEATFHKGGKSMTRRMNADRSYQAPGGETVTLAGRSVMLVRNVGHLMATDLVFDGNGNEVFEGLLDALVTSTCSLHDLEALGEHRNSRAGSIYIVKPKMHGPEEAAFAGRIFDRVEDILGLARHTIKIGVMDEERRTTVNLKECIREVRDRIVFINTGFLDRTGDEIHTSMEAGPMLPKDQIKEEPWILAYEDWNVDIGLECGFRGRAQIGKGMWPKPDEMADMVRTKAAHPQAGASCAWVPSPTAATLHAMHYHAVSVADRQAELAKRERASLRDILTVPLLRGELTDEVIAREVDNNVQGILGYVVRWIDQGVGCSKVPDISDVGLMEDRATLRISSQHLANWLRHGIIDAELVDESLLRMAAIVDRQNASDPAYRPMAPDPEGSFAMRAARALIYEGCEQPSGYTEPLLHAWRRKAKAAFGQA